MQNNTAHNLPPSRAPDLTGLIEHRWLLGYQQFHDFDEDRAKRDRSVRAVAHFLFYGCKQTGVPAMGYGHETARAEWLLYWYLDKYPDYDEDRAEEHVDRCVRWGQKDPEELLDLDLYMSAQVANDHRRRVAREKILDAARWCWVNKVKITQTRLSEVSGCSAATVRKHQDIWKEHPSHSAGVLTPNGGCARVIESDEKKKEIENMEIRFLISRLRKKWVDYEVATYQPVDDQEDAKEAEELRQCRKDWPLPQPSLLIPLRFTSTNCSVIPSSKQIDPTRQTRIKSPIRCTSQITSQSSSSDLGAVKALNQSEIASQLLDKPAKRKRLKNARVSRYEHEPRVHSLGHRVGNDRKGQALQVGAALPVPEIGTQNDGGKVRTSESQHVQDQDPVCESAEARLHQRGRIDGLQCLAMLDVQREYPRRTKGAYHSTGSLGAPKAKRSLSCSRCDQRVDYQQHRRRGEVPGRLIALRLGEINRVEKFNTTARLVALISGGQSERGPP